MTNLEKNKKAKKKFFVLVMSASVAIIASVVLFLLAAYLDVSIAARTGLIIIAALIAVFGIVWGIIIDRKFSVFECPCCNKVFVPSVGEYIKAYHTFTKRRLTCPACGKTGMCQQRIIR